MNFGGAKTLLGKILANVVTEIFENYIKAA
jgi:hypothetical protein